MNTCKQAPGAFIPVIDRNRCEGKGPCINVCPYQVFEMFTLPPEARETLSLKGKIKGFVHRWQQANVVLAERCMACGLCVSACPEQAITLARS
ncbi:4Fe-4S dicluster domain-containing protein [Uliginosibacterium sp. TH139]|uniref:4Fe-4S dicluster domain-containing protein n=1 Tax=Uliginosibacterium sp. TH139 TaxID=2067453 RepID=UPI000C7A5841|nr:4Fe-4S binding protein [Uliginosibacterium sp. TH139]PLK47005.1 4Fe-4S ferredoxin [Uliginosibacterium sp. TH139]